MESLESRMERLTPEQRRDIEDFVDFLLLKNNFRQGTVTAAPLPILMTNAPPVISADPVTSQQQVVDRVQDLVTEEESRSSTLIPDSDQTMVHEIMDGSEDGITRDYMDYGQFESPSSPATEAVINVKRRLITREAVDKKKNVLDWVD